MAASTFLRRLAMTSRRLWTPESDLTSRLRRSALSLSRPFCSNDKPLTMDDVNDLFAEARMSLQDAMDSKGTVYFADDFNDAKEITQQTLDAFDKLCASVSAEQRQSLLDANRPKMAQLKEEFNNLEEELIHDDH